MVRWSRHSTSPSEHKKKRKSHAIYRRPHKMFRNPESSRASQGDTRHALNDRPTRHMNKPSEGDGTIYSKGATSTKRQHPMGWEEKENVTWTKAMPTHPNKRRRTTLDTSSSDTLTAGGSTSHTKTVMPKHFDKPLTCFYWATHGNCTKSDDECLYAHHNTGLVAAAPVSLGFGKAKAGNSANFELVNIQQKEEALKAREEAIMEKEKALHSREATVLNHEQDTAARKAALDQIQACIDFVVPAELNSAALTHALSEARTVSHSARRVLTRRRDEFMMAYAKSSADDELVQIGNDIVNSIDGAVGAIAGMDLGLLGIERKLADSIWKLPPNVRP